MSPSMYLVSSAEISRNLGKYKTVSIRAAHKLLIGLILFMVLSVDSFVPILIMDVHMYAFCIK